MTSVIGNRTQSRIWGSKYNEALWSKYYVFIRVNHRKFACPELDMTDGHQNDHSVSRQTPHK